MEQSKQDVSSANQNKGRKGVAWLLVVIVAIIVAAYLILEFWDVAGGGSTMQSAPDSVVADESAKINLEVSVPGSQRNIAGRYTDIALTYYLIESDPMWYCPS